MRVFKSKTNGDRYGEHRIMFAHIEGADGVGFYEDNAGRPEWYFTAAAGNGSTDVVAWVFVSEQEEPLEIVIDQRDGLAADHPMMTMKPFEWAKYIRDYAATSIANWRAERAAEAA